MLLNAFALVLHFSHLYLFIKFAGILVKPNRFKIAYYFISATE